MVLLTLQNNPWVANPRERIVGFQPQNNAVNQHKRYLTESEREEVTPNQETSKYDRIDHS